MRYFVTGATGFIGGRITRQLLHSGYRVVTIVRDPSKAEALAGQGVEVHAGDITAKESMRKPMAGADGVFHTAAWYSLGLKGRRQAWEVNVEGTRNVLELMKELEIPRGVYTSTLAVNSDTRGRLVDESYRYNGPFLSEYERTKWAAHYQVAEPMARAGLPVVIVMPGLNYGPGDTSSVRPFLVRYLTRKMSSVPAQTAFCWAHVDDTARGQILAMQKGRVGETYILAGEPYTLLDALEVAKNITGIEPPRRRVNPNTIRFVASVMSVVEKLVSVPDDYTSDNLRSAAGVTYLGDSAKAKTELGFSVRPLEEGLRETLEYELKLLSASGAE